MKVFITIISCFFFININGQERIFKTVQEDIPTVIIPKDIYNFNFNSKSFNTRVSFSGYTFHTKALFTNAKFDSAALFTQTRFNKEADFSDAVFKSPVYFREATFNSKAQFTNTKFNSNSQFILTTFNSDVTFENTQFNSEVQWSCTFNAPLNISATFNSNAAFVGVNFNSPARIMASFNSRVDFYHTTFNSEVNLYILNMDSVIRICNNYFGNNGTLNIYPVVTSANKGKTFKIVLTGTDISKIKFRYGKFRLAFNSNDDTNTREAVYLDLRRRLNELNYREDYIVLDQEYREWAYLKKDPNNVQWFRNFCQKYWWGYGYNLKLIITNTFLLYIIFIFFNLFLVKKMCFNFYRIDIIAEDIEKNQTGSIFLKSIQLLFRSVFYTGIVFFGVYFSLNNFVVDNGSLFSKKLFLMIYFFMMYLSGLICIAFITNFILSK